jgi:hypothetical protein
MGKREIGPGRQAGATVAAAKLVELPPASSNSRAGPEPASDGARSGEQHANATLAGEERERLAGAESQLREQTTELARLRDDLELLRHALPGEVTHPAAPRREARQVELPGLNALSARDYWLHRCEGFRVGMLDGTVGTVEEARYGSQLDRPDWLAVKVGRWRARLVLVPCGEVEAILPEDKLILLRRDAGDEPGQPAAYGDPATALLQALARRLHRAPPADAARCRTQGRCSWARVGVRAGFGVWGAKCR